MSTLTTEQQLLTRHVLGDPTALEDYLLGYVPRIRQYIQRKITANAEAVNRLTQQTFAIFRQKVGSIQDPARKHQQRKSS